MQAVLCVGLAGQLPGMVQEGFRRVWEWSLKPDPPFPASWEAGGGKQGWDSPGDMYNRSKSGLQLQWEPVCMVVEDVGWISTDQGERRRPAFSSKHPSKARGAAGASDQERKCV